MPTQEQRSLEKYRERLAKAEAKLADLQRTQLEVRGLRDIVTGLERLVSTQSESEVATLQTGADIEAAAHPRAVRMGRRGLSTVLREMFSDGQPRSIAEVVEGLEATGERVPSRNSIGNRLVELRDLGVLRQLGRGIYIKASNGNGNGNGYGNGHAVADAQDPIESEAASASP